MLRLLLLRRIEEKVFGGKLPIPPSTGEAKKYLPGTLADDWNVSGTRFVLTKENFKTLDTGPWSVAEIDDTIKLIAELRRATPVRIDESHYAPLPATPEKARAG